MLYGIVAMLQGLLCGGFQESAMDVKIIVCPLRQVRPWGLWVRRRYVGTMLVSYGLLFCNVDAMLVSPQPISILYYIARLGVPGAPWNHQA